MPAEMTDRRFPPPWSIEEFDECFIVRDANGQALGYFYFDEDQQSPAINRRLTRDEAKPTVRTGVPSRRVKCYSFYAI